MYFANAHGCAVIYKQPEVLKMLIKLFKQGVKEKIRKHNGGDFDSRGDETLLEHAGLHCDENLDSIEVLIEEGGLDPKKLNKRGMNMLHMAAYSSSNDTIEYLLENTEISFNARTKTQNGQALTAIDICRKKNNENGVIMIEEARRERRASRRKGYVNDDMAMMMMYEAMRREGMGGFYFR